MRRTSRHLSLKQCYDILKLEKGASLEAVKHAYRLRAFELHPDLNPGNPDASRQFQELNEAYVALSAVLRPEEETAQAKAASQNEQKAKADKKSQAEKTEQADAAKSSPKGEGKAESQATKNGEAGASSRNEPQSETQSGATQAKDAEHRAQTGAYAEQDVLRDLLNDPFARRVFEDIYSELNRQEADRQQTERQQVETPFADTTAQSKQKASSKKNTKLHQGNIAWETPRWNQEINKGVKSVVKGWLRRQIDEEQSLSMPAAALAPGKRVRLQIRKGFSGEIQTIEITLPPDFVVGKPVRLRGLGKRVGPWQGDLYLTLYNG